MEILKKEFIVLVFPVDIGSFIVSLPIIHFPVSKSVATCGPDHRHAKRWNEICLTALLCIAPLLEYTSAVANSVASLLHFLIRFPYFVVEFIPFLVVCNIAAVNLLTGISN